MKKLKMMFVAAMLFTGTQVFAQNRTHDPEQAAKRQTERMTEKLSLTEDQSAKVLNINKKIAEEMQTARTSGELTTDNRRAFRRQQTEKRDAELKKVLSEDQWTQWEAMKKEQEYRDGRRGHGQRRQKQSVN